MFEQAVIFLVFVYSVFGFTTGVITARRVKSSMTKSGAGFLGAIGATALGLVYVFNVTKVANKIGNEGISLTEFFPSIVASVIGAIFIVYVIALLKND